MPADPIDFDRLRATAEAAIPGGVCAGPAPPQTFHRNAPNLDCPECGKDAAEFIATFDPPTVIALLDRLDAMQTVVDAARDIRLSNYASAQMHLAVSLARLDGDDNE